MTPQLAVGASFHSKTRIKDLTGNGTLGMGVIGGAPMAMPGHYTIQDFEWPTTWAVGVSWQANDQWRLVADIKRLKWSETMEDFRVRFVSAMGDLNVTMKQNWDDQTVYMVGVQYQPKPGLALRAGFNYGKNPIKAPFLNPLFPATVEKHWTMGIGMRLDERNSLAAALVFAPQVTQTIPGIPGVAPDIRITHSQFTTRINWTHRF